MPTYDYECKKCQHKFEVFQSIKDNPLSECPLCKGEIKRLIGGGMGVIFKGNGFYTTDYKKSSSSKSSSPVTAKDPASKADAAKENSSGGATESKSSGESASKESTSATNKKEAIAS